MSWNGELRASELVTVYGSFQLAPRTAADFGRWRAAAARAGYDLHPASPVGAYRSRGTQADMKAHPQNYGLNPQSSMSLAPVGYSRHGFGRAVDIANAMLGTPLRSWCLDTCDTFGFHLWDKRDPNHFEHGDATVQEPATATAGGTTKEIDMPLDNSDIAAIAKSVWEGPQQATLGGNAPGVVLQALLGWVQGDFARLAEAVWERPQQTMDGNAPGIVLRAGQVNAQALNERIEKLLVAHSAGGTIDTKALAADISKLVTMPSFTINGSATPAP